MSDATLESRIRLLLLDEMGLLRASLARVLEAAGFEVSGQCSSCAEGLERLQDSPADIVLLDFEVGREPSTDFIAAAKEAGYRGRFLIVTAAPDARKAAVAFRAGASGIFLKSEPPERLLKAIEIVEDGGVWVDPRIIQLLAEQLLNGHPRFTAVHEEDSRKLLDEREQNVLLGVLGGLSNKKIGNNLGVSESSVKNVMQRLFGKAGVKTRSQLVRVALEGSLGALGIHSAAATNGAMAVMKSCEPRTGQPINQPVKAIIT